MTVTLIYKCRLCGGWARHEDRRPIKRVPVVAFLDWRSQAVIHNCSDKMAGVADFAGVEVMKEEEEAGD